MNSSKYSVVRANGDIESIRVPLIFSPFEVAKRLHHDLVFMHLTKGQNVFVDGYNPTGSGSSLVVGPAVVFVRNDEKMFWVPRAPTNDTDALHIWKEYGRDALAIESSH